MTASATISIAPQTIIVSPATVSVHPGDNAQFSAKLLGVSSSSLTWTLSGPGTLSSTGLYTAPATATKAATATITAVSAKAKGIKGHGVVNIVPQTIGGESDHRQPLRRRQHAILGNSNRRHG